MEVNLIGGIEDEHREEDIKYKVRIDIADGLYGFMQKACAVEQAASIESSDHKAEAEQAHCVGKA